MVAKCVNPECDARFLYFREGQLFVTYRNSTETSGESCAAMYPRFFWLCEYCSTRMTLKIDSEGTPIVRRKSLTDCEHHSVPAMSELYEPKAA
jgi:hypothetical protein